MKTREQLLHFLHIKQSFVRFNSKVSVSKHFVIDIFKHVSLFTSCTGKKADCTISMSDSDLFELMTGRLNPQTVRFDDGLFFIEAVLISRCVSV